MTAVGRNARRASPGTSCAPQAPSPTGSTDQPVLLSGRFGRRRAHLPRWFAQLTRLGWPRRFPIVQFPNVPLLAAIVAGRASDIVNGRAGSYLLSVSYVAMTVWAYEELVHGVNWFRRLLGLVFTVVLTMRVAHAVYT
jgi:hypothetical protein